MGLDELYNVTVSVNDEVFTTCIRHPFNALAVMGTCTVKSVSSNNIIKVILVCEDVAFIPNVAPGIIFVVFFTNENWHFSSGHMTILTI